MADTMTERCGILVPGSGYTTQAPLLDFAGQVVEQRGGGLREISWATRRREQDWPEYVRDAVVDELAQTTGAVVIIAKSVGTWVAPLGMERRLPMVLLTPIIRQPRLYEPLASATAPVLLVGGTADPLWDSDTARSTGHEVFEIPRADHALRLPGDVRATLRVLGDVVARIDAFLDRVWP